MLVLETLDAARARGARIYAELAGSGLSANAGVWFGVPGGEDAQPLVGGCARLGGEDHEALAAAVGAVPGVAVEGEVTDERVRKSASCTDSSPTRTASSGSPGSLAASMRRDATTVRASCSQSACSARMAGSVNSRRT